MVIKRWVLALLCAAMLTAVAQEATTRGQGVEAPDGKTPVGDQHLFVIAIDRYQHWNPLSGAVAEAAMLRQVLLERYAFTPALTVSLENGAATRGAIIRQLRRYAEDLKPHDSLLILYCGHGHLDRFSRRGFWIPVDGGLDDIAQENWLSNAELRGYLHTIVARRILVIADACFAGDLLTVTRARPEEISEAYYRRAYQMVARQVLTSGGLEVVNDASAFGTALHRTLRDNTEPYIDPAKLFVHVRAAVKGQQPLLGSLREVGHEDGGSYIFFLRTEETQGSATLPPLPAPPSLPPPAEPSPLPVAPWFAMVDGQRTAPLTLSALQALAQQGKLDAATLVWRTGMAVWLPAGEVDELRGRVKAAPLPMVPPDAPPAMEPAGRWQVPPGFRAAAGTVAEPYTDTGWAKEIAHEATGIEMVYVPAGSFIIGSPANEIGRGNNEVQHRVTLTKGFYLGKYEVTQGQWRQVMGNAPSQFKNAGVDAPVESVSWDDCQAFCRKLGEGFRLPTEAEWEYACRAGSTTALYTGPLTIRGTYNGPELDAIAWYGGNSGVTYEGGYDSTGLNQKHFEHSRAGTQRVGQKKPNAWGLYDMYGNVREWCQDLGGDYPTGAVTDPIGPGAGSNRVYRGGSWISEAMYCRSASRHAGPPRYRNEALGFRLAFAVETVRQEGAPRQADVGGVAFVTEPPGVKVFIDGQERGETKASSTSQLSAPFEVAGLTVGPHRLSLTKPQHAPRTVTFTVEGGETVQLDALKLTERWSPTHTLKLINNRVYSGVLLQTDPDGSIVFERSPRVKVTYRKDEVRSVEELKEALP